MKNDFSTHSADVSSVSDVKASLQAQMQEMEETIASLGPDATCQQALVELKRFETNLMSLVEPGAESSLSLWRDRSLLTQILEVGNLLHRNLNLDSLLQEIVQVVHQSLGFGTVVLNLVDEDSKQVRVAAHSGLDDEGRQLLEGAVYAWEDFANLLQEQFRVGRCYLVPHDEFNWGRDFEGPVYKGIDDEASGDGPSNRWHPDDALIVPIELGEGQIVGIISVDEPLRGLRPGPETLRALEIFAQQAASAIENARLYEQAQQEIAERKRAEEVMVRERDLLQALMDNVPDMIFFKDAESRVIRSNRAHARLLGFDDPQEAIGKTDFDFFSPEDAPRFYEEEQEIIRSGQPIVDRVGQTPDLSTGELHWLSETKVRLESETGHPVGLVGIARDITERKQAEAELQRRSAQLQTAAEVSHAATSILDPDELIQQVVNLVRDRFELYYAGLFLVDRTGEWTGEPGRWAALRAGTGEAGRQMLQAGHKLEVGGTSMIGWCVANAQARIALDVGEEAVRFENPWLPETRSEMALPLIARGQVIGAMTIQSTQEAAFSDEDIAVLQTMADQLAVAIENARLFVENARLLDETQRALQEARTAHQQYLRREWGSFLASRQDEKGTGYILTRDGLKPASQAWPPEIHLAMQSQQPVILTDAEEAPLPVLSDAEGPVLSEVEGTARSALATPITLRGQVIGALDLFDPEHPREWTDDDLALVDAVTSQVALAVENSRLFEKTQVALAEIQALYRASHRITTSADLPTLYQVLVDEMTSRLGADQCQLTIFDHLNGYGEIVAEHRPTPDVDKAPIPIASSPAYVILRDTRRPVTIEDKSSHPAFASYKDGILSLSEGTAAGEGTRSMLLVPIQVRGQLIGSLEIDYEGRERAISEAELDFCQTLAGQAAITIDNMRAFEEQKETAERLREMDKLKTQFLANMSHELRTPLNSIIGFSRVILKGIDGPLTEMQETDLTAIYSSGQHLLGLINDILDLSKIGAGKMELNFDEADLKPIIKGVMSSAAGLVKDKRVELEQHVPDELPNIWADATRIRQVLLNLVSNATKFTEEGRITLTAGYDDEWVTISITDSGVGIPAEKLDTIFEEFTQVDGQTTRSVGGTGLGLPISRYFIEMHGGKISVESDLGVGSTFTVTLPTYVYTQPEIESVERGPSTGEKPSAAERRLVLAVDDDPGVISLYRRFLEAEQRYEVVGVTNSDEVIDKASELQPFAITLDVLMPNKDGWQVLRELKACPQTQHIPIIVCSIVGNEGLGFSLGAADYLVKPIMEEELLAVLSRVDQQGEEEIEVLVIDDQADDILLIRRMLEAQRPLEAQGHLEAERPLEAQRPYRVIEADGGQTGIDLVHQRKPDIVILDLMMPEVDGFVVLEDLKREPDTRDIPVIIITAKELTEEEQEQLNGQVEVLLRKGLFSEQELLEDLGRALSRIGSH